MLRLLAQNFLQKCMRGTKIWVGEAVKQLFLRKEKKHGKTKFFSYYLQNILPRSLDEQKVKKNEAWPVRFFSKKITKHFFQGTWA